MIILFDKLIKKLIRVHRKRAFKKYTKTKHNNFQLVGNVNLINKKINIGKNVTIFPDVTFWGDGEISIGDNVTIGQGTIIFSSKQCGGIEIGSGTIIAAYCYIIDMDHGIKKDQTIIQQENIYSKIKIGNDVWIAAGSKILRGTTIEDGAVIGAQSVVKGMVKKNSVVAGVPAKIIKYRE